MWCSCPIEGVGHTNDQSRQEIVGHVGLLKRMLSMVGASMIGVRALSTLL